MQSLDLNMVRRILHDFVDVTGFASSAVVCSSWCGVFGEQQFWQNACLRRWPSSATLPLRDFMNFYRTRSTTGSSIHERAQDEKFRAWLQDMYFLIEATLEEKAVSLVLSFSSATCHGNILSWQLKELGYDLSLIESAAANQFETVHPFVNIKSCHLWRASAEKMCTVGHDICLEYDAGLGCLTGDVKAVLASVFEETYLECTECMHYCLRYSRTEHGVVQDSLFEANFNFFLLYNDEAYDNCTIWSQGDGCKTSRGSLPVVSKLEPVLALHITSAESMLIEGIPVTSGQRNQNVGDCDFNVNQWPVLMMALRWE